MSGLRKAGSDQRAPGRPPRRPPRLRHAHVAGLEEAPGALFEPELSQKDLGARRPPHRGEAVPATTRAAKWATRQVEGGGTVSEVAEELACDWHTVNNAVLTYGEALLAADRKRMNKTSAIGRRDLLQRTVRSFSDRDPPGARHPPIDL